LAEKLNYKNQTKDFRKIMEHFEDFTTQEDKTSEQLSLEELKQRMEELKEEKMKQIENSDLTEEAKANKLLILQQAADKINELACVIAEKLYGYHISWLLILGGAYGIKQFVVIPCVEGEPSQIAGVAGSIIAILIGLTIDTLHRKMEEEQIA
jgi:hypothetical protein